MIRSPCADRERKLKEKMCMVTSSNRGIGRAIALGLAQCGTRAAQDPAFVRATKVVTNHVDALKNTDVGRVITSRTFIPNLSKGSSD